MRLPDAGHGFGSQMVNFVNEALVAMYSGTPIALCRPPGFHDGWAEHFVNPGLAICEQCSIPQGAQVWCSGATASMDSVERGGDDAELLIGIKRFLSRKLFQLKSHVDKDATLLQHHLGLLSQPYVGIHIRRGDKLQEAGFFRSTGEFAGHALRLCDSMNTTKVFVASDDPGAADEVRAWYQNASRTDIEVVSQPPLHTWQYAQRSDKYDSSTMKALLNDIVLLIRANAYVGTASSSFDRFVWFMRDPAEQSISLDDGGSFVRRSC